MPAISSGNAVYMLTIAGLYAAPQQLQGFSADDIFDTASINPVEAVMGLDGKLSAGYVPVPIQQGITLQADSDSNTLFDAWFTAMQAAREVFFANGIIHLSSIKRGYALLNGVLTAYSPMPDAKKMLQPRKYSITWESMTPAPL